jgi:DNA (cytosine-5)-methyltransferase 1
MSLTFGSLFSGIGGIDLGLERAGMRCAFQVELDSFARLVLQKHWPAVPRFDDVREVGAHNLPEVDLLCGGFPCQDISNAGKRAGIEGARSGLWKEFARIIRELRPRFVLVENVAALRARGLGRVLGDLAALGFDAEWDCIPAASLGAPHLRDRLFLVAYSNGCPLRKESEPEPRRPGTPVVRANGSARSVAHADRERFQKQRRPQPIGSALTPAQRRSEALADTDRGGCSRTRSLSEGQSVTWENGCRIFGEAPQCSDWWIVEPPVGRVAHGFRSRVDQLRCLGNAVVPQVAEHVGRRILAFDSGR